MSKPLMIDTISPIECPIPAVLPILRPLALSGISRITDDILWYIFQGIVDRQPLRVNLDCTDVPALQDIWRYCQVCQAWRNSILPSAGLWAKLIDLNALNDKNSGLRVEVLTRSGTGRLWIYGNIGRTQSDQRFFFQLLDKHFKRIEKLVVTIPVEIEDTQRWIAVSESAPVLRRFEVSSEDTPHCEEFTMVRGNNRLFLGAAPMLQNLSLDRFRWTPDPIPTWTAALRMITLGHCISHSELHALLSNTPVLEFLSLRGPIIPDQYPSSIIQLPCLRMLNIRGLLATYIPFVTLIQPSPGCSFNFEVRHNGKVPSEDAVLLQTWLRQLLQAYILHCNPNRLEARISNRELALANQTQEADNGYFRIDAYTYAETGRPPNIILPFYLEICQPLNRSQIKELDLNLRDKGIDAQFHHPLLTFLLSFIHLETLRITENTLQVLLQTYEDNACAFFPKLRKLEIYGLLKVGGVGTDWSSCDGAALERYLSERRERGTLPDIVEFSYLSTSWRSYDLRSLDKFTGLQICYTVDGEKWWHRCGEGTPENLRLLPQNIGSF